MLEFHSCNFTILNFFFSRAVLMAACMRSLVAWVSCCLSSLQRLAWFMRWLYFLTLVVVPVVCVFFLGGVCVGIAPLTASCSVSTSPRSTSSSVRQGPVEARCQQTASLNRGQSAFLVFERRAALKRNCSTLCSLW